MINPEVQAYQDRAMLTYREWPYYYFNYHFSPVFEQHIIAVCELLDPGEFKEKIIELFQLHYLAGIMSMSKKHIQNSEIHHAHFADMQYGASAVATATCSTQREIIDNALSEMLYYDLTYSWSDIPPLGKMNHYYSAKSLLHQIKRTLDKNRV